jgi:hypothetical protein
MTKGEKFDLALITGASSGIGEALSRKLAEKGVSLILCGRNVKRLQAIADELGNTVEVEIVCADLAQREERKKVVEIIRHKAPDLVINNAGYGSYGQALSYDTQEMLDLLEVDANAVLEFSLEATRALVDHKKEGVVMNVSSVAAFQIFPLFAVYSAAKAFVNQFSESFDQETQKYGVRVLTACPGMVATGFRSRAAGEPGDDPPGALVMSADFAAEEILRQIAGRKPMHIFDWKYRVGVFFSKYILPKSLVARVLRSNIKSRITK